MAIAGSLHSLRVVVVYACCVRLAVLVIIPVIVLAVERVFEFFHAIRRHDDGALALDLAGVFLVVRTFWAHLMLRGVVIVVVVRQVLVAFGAVCVYYVILCGRVIPFIRVCVFSVLGGDRRLLANDRSVVCSGDESPRLVCQLEARPFIVGWCVCVVASHVDQIGRLFDCYYNYKL